MSLAIVLATLGTHSAAANDLTATAHHADGKSYTLTEARFLADWKLQAKHNSLPVTLAIRDLVSIRFSNESPPARPRGPYLLLSTGELLGGSVIGTEDDSLRLRGEAFDEVTIPLTAVAAVVLDSDHNPALQAKLTALVQQRPRKSDQILLKNQDIIAGSLLGIDADRIRVGRDGGEERLIARELVSAIAFDPSLTQYELGTQFRGQVRLADGSAFSVLAVESVGNKLKFTTGFGSTIAAAPAQLVDMTFRNGRVVYLSDLTPTLVENRPYLDDPMPHRLDRSVIGGPLRVGGKVYPKGIGVRSYSRLAYAISGFTRFEAVAGVDAAAGPYASVRFLVLLDGQPAFDSGEMTLESAAKPIELSIEGKKTLELIVEYAKRGDVQDYADWCDARLIR